MSTIFAAASLPWCFPMDLDMAIQINVWITMIYNDFYKLDVTGMLDYKDLYLCCLFLRHSTQDSAHIPSQSVSFEVQ